MNGEKLEALTWEEYNPLGVRGAGHPFLHDGMLIRPVQISTDQSYGDRVAFMRVEITQDSYRETRIAALSPGDVRAKGVFFDGLHTYNRSEHFETIDIRCGKLSLLKPFHRAGRMLKKLTRNKNAL